MDALTADQTKAYLARLGLQEPVAADLDTLGSLVQAHLQRVTFENIDALLDRPIDLDANSLFAKIVKRGRGGYCFELNSFFARLLLALGYNVRLRMARLRWRRAPEAPHEIKQHLVLIVTLPDGEYVVDVGFGGPNPHLPLPFKETPGCADHPYKVRAVGEREDCEPGTLEVCLRDGEEWLPLYRVEPRDQRWIDCKPLNWYASTHPDSVVHRLLVVGRGDGVGWLNLANGHFTRRLHRIGAAAVENRVIRDVDELLYVLQNEFSVPLCPDKDVGPLRARLAMLLRTGDKV